MEMRKSFSLIHDEVATINSTLQETLNPESVKVIQNALKKSRRKTGSIQKGGTRGSRARTATGAAPQRASSLPNHRVSRGGDLVPKVGMESPGSIPSADLPEDGAVTVAQFRARKGRRVGMPNDKARSRMCAVM